MEMKLSGKAGKAAKKQGTEARDTSSQPETEDLVQGAVSQVGCQNS